MTAYLERRPGLVLLALFALFLFGSSLEAYWSGVGL